MNIRENRGITLVMLIVTIVVLLILSGITISAITGGENTMDKANEAKLSTEAKAEMEEIQKKIDTASSKAIRYGNYSGSADAKTIQGELKSLVTDTSMITGVGPWQVTGSKTGTKYLITENNELILYPTYEQKEYIKSTGTQYIDTDVNPANTIDFEMTFKTDVNKISTGYSNSGKTNCFFGASNYEINKVYAFNFSATQRRYISFYMEK